MTTTYPLVRRLLGTMGADWRAERSDPLDYLAHHVDRADAAAVSAELGELCARAASEYDYVSLIVASGARFTPYGQFGTAADFVHQLRERLASPAVVAPAVQETEQAEDAEPEAATYQVEPVADELSCPRLGKLLVMLYAKGLTTPSHALDAVDHGLGRLIDRGDVEPLVIAAELADLLEGEHTEADLVRVVSRTGVGFTPDPAYPTTTDFLRGLRQRLAEPTGGGPEYGVTPAAVVEGTLTALKQGDLHAAMTGLARMYGAPELGTAAFPVFEQRVGELLDHVLPHAVADYVDDVTLAAETVADDASWTRARWMRSAVELLLTAHAGRAAADFVDRAQVAQIDDLLCAPTCGFGVPVGRTHPRFPNSHWWWALESRSVAPASRAGLPMHARWYPAQGVWRVRVPLGDTGAADETAVARDLSRRLLDATTAAFGAHLKPRSATAMVQVLDAEGSVDWADASMTAEVREGAFVVTDPDLASAPPGERVVTVATVRGLLGRGGHRAEWSVEVLRRRGDDGRVLTVGGSAVFSLTDGGELGAGDADALATALRAWEEELDTPLTDWRSSTHPTLVSRYGLGCEVFAAGPPRARPLLTGVSKHLWAGELRLGLVGICRAYGAGLLDDPVSRVWQDDWIAALAAAGREPVEEFLTGLVDETRRLDYPRWHQLCAARSGIQLVGERLDDERLAGLFPVDAVRQFDDAMRSFGRRFGPVPRGHVPGEQGGANPLWDGHPWWRYPANATDAGTLVDLDGLATALWAELDRPERERRTKASTRSLATVVRAVQAVCEGESAGFTERVAHTVCEQVTERWDLGASLTDDVLKYFQPIARSTGWPLPARTVRR